MLHGNIWAKALPAAIATAAMTAATACKCAVWPYERGTMSTPSPLATLNQAALMLVGRKNTTYKRLLGTLLAPLLRLTLQQQKYMLSRDCNAMLQYML